MLLEKSHKVYFALPVYLYGINLLFKLLVNKYVHFYLSQCQKMMQEVSLLHGKLNQTENLDFDFEIVQLSLISVFFSKLVF